MIHVSSHEVRTKSSDLASTAELGSLKIIFRHFWKIKICKLYQVGDKKNNIFEGNFQLAFLDMNSL